METLVAAQNQEISNLQTLVNSLENNLSVKSYVKTSTGYRLTFSDGSTIDITNGRDGDTGMNGTNGSDGSTPIMGVRLGTDGKYYWTVTIDGVTSDLLDENGNKVSASGDPGRIGDKGDKGETGVTPLLKVDDQGYWIVSYNLGISYSRVLDTNGNPVSALGAQGDGGTSSISLITAVSQADGYVVMTLYNGTVLQLPIYNNLGIQFSSDEVSFTGADSVMTVTYTISGADSNTFVETVDKGNVKSSVASLSTTSGTITIQKTGTIETDTKVLVLLCNKTQTITSVLNVTADSDSRLDDVVPEDIQAKLGAYIDIYKGVNPPNVEGAFLMNPTIVVYCSDYADGSGYEPGEEITPYDLRLYNQNVTNNTINFEGYEVYDDEEVSYETGPGAFISGSGNCFSIFFNSIGICDDINFKTAVIISGEITSGGIKNLYYAFVMVSKDPDPEELLVDAGVFRIFRDGDSFSPSITWNHAPATRSLPSYNKAMRRFRGMKSYMRQ